MQHFFPQLSSSLKSQIKLTENPIFFLFSCKIIWESIAFNKSVEKIN